jgi:hypothetical protein
MITNQNIGKLLLLMLNLLISNEFKFLVEVMPTKDGSKLNDLCGKNHLAK